MPQIPDWTALPGATPQPSYRRIYPDDSAAAVMGDVANLGATIERNSNEQLVQQQQLADAKVHNAVEQHALAVQTATQGLREDIASGKVPYDQAHAQLSQAIGQIPQPDLSGARPAAATLLQGLIQRNIAQAQFGIDNAVDAARKDDHNAQFYLGLNTLGKQAAVPGADIDDINARADIYRPLGRNAGLPEAMIDKTIQEFKDRNWFNQATQRTMESKDSLPALQQLQHDLTDDNGYYAGRLTTENRNVILHSVIGETDALENRIARAQEKVELHAQMTLGRIDQQISSGVPATPDMWASWQSAVKGTSAEPEFDQRLKEEQTIQDVLRRPVDQQWDYVQQREKDLMQQGGSVHDKMMLDRLGRAVRANTELLTEKPLLFDAQRNGADVTPLDFSNLNTPDGQASIFAQVNQRMVTLAAMRKEYGPSVGLAPLLPQEVSQLTAQLQRAPASDRTALVTALHTAMNNDDAYVAAMQQIAPKSPVTAIAGSWSPPSAGAGPAWYDKNFAPQLSDVQHVFRGESLLNPSAAGARAKSLPAEESSDPGWFSRNIVGRDKVIGLREEFDEASRGLFPGRPLLAGAHYDIFRDALASLLAEKGDTMGDAEAYTWERQQALKIALGNTIDYNGSKVAVPKGMDPSMFKWAVDTAVETLAQERMSGTDHWRENMDGYQLRELGGLGSGRYQLTMGNADIVAGGKPFTIDLRTVGRPPLPQEILRTQSLSMGEAYALGGGT
jgi:hypothetical protein